jgi:hypothetical protein
VLYCVYLEGRDLGRGKPQGVGSPEKLEGAFTKIKAGVKSCTDGVGSESFKAKNLWWRTKRWAFVMGGGQAEAIGGEQRKTWVTWFVVPREGGQQSRMIDAEVKRA